MTDIAFLSFEFAPLNIGGIFRPLKFAKYLPDFGIRPHIYTLDPQHYSRIFNKPNQDNSMLEDLKGKEVVIKHIPIQALAELDKSKFRKFLRIYFSIYRGSEYKLWRKNLLSQIYNDAKSTKFKALVVTAPPFGMLALGFEIAKKLNIPLILDMRDAWAFWNSTPYGSYAHFYATVLKERKYFSLAHKVIATSDQTIEDWHLLHPGIPLDKFACITNGFDKETIPASFDPFELEPLQGKKEFKIVYVGSFYYSPDARKQMMTPTLRRKGHRMLQYYPRKQDWLYRSPYFFFRTLQKVFELRPSWKSKIKIEFAGRPQEWMDKMIEETCLQDVVRQIGFVNHNESIRLQQNADALLITSAKVEGGRDCFIAGKTFEYLTMNKPIISFVSEGSQKDILQNSGLGLLFNPDNIEESALTMIAVLENGKSFTPNETYLSLFDRKILTGKLANIISEAISSNWPVDQNPVKLRDFVKSSR